MKILPAVLFFGAVLIAALPVAADGISHPGIGKEFSGILLDGKVDGDKYVYVLDSRSFLVVNAFFSDLRDDKFRRDGVMDWSFIERGSFSMPDSKGWSVDNQGRGWDNRGKKEDFGATAVPEPGSLVLLLFGLTAVGFLAPRRLLLARAI